MRVNAFFLVGSVSLEADFRRMKLMANKVDTFSSKQIMWGILKLNQNLANMFSKHWEKVTLQLVCFRVRESTAMNEDP